ncbi:MAG: ribonuclease HII [Candidatus Omnitrophica bacterium]|nr:ribonuclease HII [Candidatus Omnitrophota bacterium]
MFDYENHFKIKGFDFVIGVDEAGRGPLAGPVVAAAVLLKNHQFKNRIDDSKKLTPQQRENAYQEIVQNSFFSLGLVDHHAIDRINILQAAKLAMEQAVIGVLDKVGVLDKKKVHVIVDGNMPLSLPVSTSTLVKGDSLCKSIACGSILAKVVRDKIMHAYEDSYPGYGFAKHKGYGTLSHRNALKKLGVCLIHRKSFLKGVNFKDVRP